MEAVKGAVSGRFVWAVKFCAGSCRGDISILLSCKNSLTDDMCCG